MPDEATVVECPGCGAANDLPIEALRLGRYRCHHCGQTNPVPPGLGPREQPVAQQEPVQTTPSFTTSRYNTPEVNRQAEAEASRLGCLVALALGPLLVLGLILAGG